MRSQPNYVSVFKINGVPIRPPVITAEKRKKIREDYEKAIALEQQLRKRSEYKILSKKNLLHDDTLNNNLTTSPPSSFILSPDNMKNGSSSLETLVPFCDDIEIRSNISNVSLSGFSELSNADTLAINISLNESGSETFRCLYTNLSPSHSDNEVIQSPKTLCLSSQKPSPRHLVEEKAVLYNSAQNLTTSFDVESPERPIPHIVRSNSFTLEGPSPMLLKHMEATGVQLQSKLPSHAATSTPTQKATNFIRPPINYHHLKKSLNHKCVNYKTATVKAKVQSNAPIRGTTPELKKKQREKIVTNSSISKSGDGGNSSVSCRASTTTKSDTGDFRTNCKINSSRSTGGNQNHTTVTMHLSKLQDLLKKQRSEYERLCGKFMTEQCMLLQDSNVPELLITQHCFDSGEESRYPYSHLEEIDRSLMYANHLCRTETEVGPESPVNGITLVENSPETFYTASRGISLSKSSSDSKHRNGNVNKSCSRQLFGNEIEDSHSSAVIAQEPSYERMEEHAATIINAHVRGYLVRRLFKSEEIQAKVRTIYDTLDYILDLCDDHCDSHDDVMLKARLVQQLEAALHDMYFVFTEMTHAQRMNIIAKDRERLKTQLERQVDLRKKGHSLGLEGETSENITAGRQKSPRMNL